MKKQLIIALIIISMIVGSVNAYDYTATEGFEDDAYIENMDIFSGDWNKAYRYSGEKRTGSYSLRVSKTYIKLGVFDLTEGALMESYDGDYVANVSVTFYYKYGNVGSKVYIADEYGNALATSSIGRSDYSWASVTCTYTKTSGAYAHYLIFYCYDSTNNFFLVDDLTLNIDYDGTDPGLGYTNRLFESFEDTTYDDNLYPETSITRDSTDGYTRYGDYSCRVTQSDNERFILLQDDPTFIIGNITAKVWAGRIWEGPLTISFQNSLNQTLKSTTLSVPADWYKALSTDLSWNYGDNVTQPYYLKVASGATTANSYVIIDDIEIFYAEYDPPEDPDDPNVVDDVEEQERYYMFVGGFILIMYSIVKVALGVPYTALASLIGMFLLGLAMIIGVGYI